MDELKRDRQRSSPPSLLETRFPAAPGGPLGLGGGAWTSEV